MEIIIADKSGFCFGVQRAFDIAKKHFGTDFQTFGPLIHNPVILKKITQNKGKIAENIEEINSETVVIRAHGISQKNLQKIQKKAKNIEDATCPFVIRLHQKAKEFTEKGYQLIIVGQKNHPEIKAITEDNPKTIAIFSEEEAKKLAFTKKLAILAQTTEKQEKFYKIIEILKEKSEELVFEETICNDVRERQLSAKRLAKKVELVIVVGGKTSSNTRKIYEICEKITKAHQIEGENELKTSWFKNINKVGIITGASTPTESLEKVIKKIEKIAKK